MGQSNPSQDANLATLIEGDEERSYGIHDSAGHYVHARNIRDIANEVKLPASNLLASNAPGATNEAKKERKILVS